MKMIRLVGRFILLAAFLVLGLGIASAQDESTDEPAVESPAIVTTEGTPASLCEAAGEPEALIDNQFERPDEVLEEGIDYRAIFCTDVGPIYVDLFEKQSPVTVNSFLFLAYNGYYNQTIFHRVIEDFMAQGGDPTETGRGGPGYQFNDEVEPYLIFDRPGLLAMANVGTNPQTGAGTNGSQFFITTAETPHLDYRHTIFGEVLEGYENVEAIQIRDPEAGGDATRIDTVLIVTDPLLVETTYEGVDVAVQADVEEALSSASILAAATALFGQFPGEEVSVETDSLTPEEAIAAAPNSIKAPLESFLAENQVEYVVSATMTTPNCSLDIIPFISIGYTIYATPSAEIASAALDKADTAVLGVANGQSTVGGLAYDRPVYTGETNACDIGATAGRVFYTRGRYIVEAETVIPADAQYAPAMVIEHLSSIIFDRALSSVIRDELK
jgi:cyclophilin family peptidyl-prolyl cis-trans isomerase